MNDTQKAAAALGRKGGLSRSPAKKAAGKRNLLKARESLTAEQRKERAKKAAAARWNKKMSTR